ncbi:hypothetical protein [Floridanema evergladense]
MNTVNQLSANYGIDPAKMQNVMSTVGSLIRPVLQQQKSLPNGNLENFINQAINAHGNTTVLQSLISPQVQQQIIQAITQITGLSANQVQTILPTIVASVASLLNMGAIKPEIQDGGNQVLNVFLNAEKDQDVDLGDVIKFSSRFLNPLQAA